MLFNNQKFLITRFILILALMVNLAGISITPVAAAPGDTTLISLGSIASPLAANNSSYRPSISADGRYVAFYSGATNLVSGDTNGKLDIFVFDRQSDLAERVSVDSSGVQANGDSSFPAISADGRYVAFVSDATTLVNDDTNGKRDIFIHDRQTGLTRRVSAAPYEQADDSGYVPPALSADGRYVAYGMGAIFVFDCQTGITERVSMGPGGIQANAASYTPSISANGRYVAFESSATNLVSDDTNNAIDVFVFDRQTLQTERVSVDSIGGEANSSSGWLSISADGNYVAFGSDASNLVNDDTNSEHDIFVHDRQNGLTERVSVSSSGAEGNYNSTYPSISSDGRYVAFASYANTLVSDDTNNSWDVFVHDRQTQMTERVSVDSSGVAGNSHSYWSSISSDGRYVAFESGSGNLDTLLQSGGTFVHDRQTGETESVSVGPVGMYANYGSYVPSISADGRYVAFLSGASNLVSGDTNRSGDLFVYDRQTGSMELVSVSSSGVQTNDGASEPSISADGRYVVFDSQANNLVDDDTNDNWDVFVHDRQTGVTERVSVSSSGVQGNSSSRFPAISANGRYVAFESFASNLVPSDTGVGDIFLRDLQTDTTERISVAPGGVLPNGGSFYKPSISADGRYVAFRSNARNLTNGDANGKEDIFVYDRQLGITELVSIDSSGLLQANNHSSIPSISADGRYVSFVSTATNLVPDDTNSVEDVFIHDRQTGETKRVSVDSSGVQATASSNSASISADGRYISFASTASNLVSDDTNNMTDIFVHDTQTGITQRMTVDSNGAQANAASSSPSISANGQFVTFSSSASNLVYGDGNYVNDIFLHENSVLPDTPPTVVSIIRADADSTSASNVDFAVTFSEDVTGVNTTAPFNDFTLTTTGVTGASIIAVSGSGNSYMVTANTGTGSGTIRLDLTDNDSIEDVAGNKLGGTSAGDGDFITGETYIIHKTIPILVSPGDIDSLLTLRPVFDWEDVNGALNYNIQVSKNNIFTQLVLKVTTVSSTYIPTKDLPKNIPLYWRVRAKIGTTYGDWSEVRSFTTPVNPPPAPVLLLPASNFLTTNYTPAFTWKAIIMPTGTTFQNYIIQVDNNSDFSSPEVEDNTPTTPTFTPIDDFDSNTKYYWRVRAVNTDDETGNWSVVRYFRTALLSLTLVSPVDGFASPELRPFFDWSDSNIAPLPTGYTIQISKNNTFTQIVHTGNPTTSNYIPTANLPKGGLTLYWRVQAKGTNGPSAWSGYRSLTTPVNPSPAPLLVSPASNALMTTYIPTFTWKAVVMPGTTSFKNYIVQVDNDPAFGSPEVNDSTSTDKTITSLVSPATLNSNTKYCWRVRAVNMDNEMGNWSAVRYFRTSILPPTLSTPTDISTVGSLKPALDWEDVTGASGYIVQVSLSPTFTTKIVSASTVSSTYTLLKNLPSDATLYWRVQAKPAKGSNGPSPWSVTFSFAIPVTP